jgi:hypothetical protein
MRILHRFGHRLGPRVGVSVAAVTALGTAFAAGAIWNGEHDPGQLEASNEGAHPQVHVANALIRSATDCDDLLKNYVNGNIDQVGPYGWGLGGPIRYADGLDGGFGGAPVPTVPGYVAQSGSGPEVHSDTSKDLGMHAVGSSRTGTNVQEHGVDEPDTVKTDGHLLLRLSDHRLAVYDVSGARPRRLGSTDIDRSLTDPEFLLVGDRAVVTGQRYDQYDVGATTTYQLTVDLTDPASPKVVDERHYSAATLSVRQHGPVVREVLTTGLPSLDFVQPSDKLTPEQATKKNKEIVRQSTISDWLPSVTVGDGKAQQLVDCTDVSIPADANPSGGVWIVGYDADAPGTASTSGLAAASSLAYESRDRLYVATSAMPFGFCCPWPMAVPDVVGGPMPVPTPGPDEYGTTDLHAFALSGTAVTYAASGTVDGAIRDRWSMDSVDGVLRVAVGPTPATGNFNAIVTFKEEGDDLVELGHLYKLGVNEQIQSMRWFDGLAVMVTYRQVDPFYAIDLTDPAHPKLLGKLKVPGYSSYLHPLGPQRFLAMGQIDGRAQAAVYFVADVEHPKQTSKITYATGTTANAGADPRQFTWLPDKRTALTVISRGWNGQTGWVSVLSLHNGQLSNRMIEADYGYDVADIRTVELPNGRVVLVTDDGVRFLAL